MKQLLVDHRDEVPSLLLCTHIPIDMISKESISVKDIELQIKTNPKCHTWTATLKTILMKIAYELYEVMSALRALALWAI